MSYFENGITLYPNYTRDNTSNFVQNMNIYLVLEDKLTHIKNEKKIKELWNIIQQICFRHNIYIKSNEQLKRDIVYYMYIKDRVHIH